MLASARGDRERSGFIMWAHTSCLIGTEVKLCVEELSSLSALMTTAEAALMKEMGKQGEKNEYGVL